MIFLWPWLLLLFLLVPLLIGPYILMLRRKRKFAVRYASVALIREALPRYARWRQHLPFALFLTAVALLTMAVARPAAQIEVPLSRTSIILALDVSRSMCNVDVPPNRLTVAQEAALGFIEDQADGTQIGIVAFAGFAQLVVPPTTDKEILKEAVESFTTSFGTAIGSATLESIDAIATINPDIQFSGVDLSDVENELLAQDAYVPDIIVLLTDG
ncbi:MAG: VWA domain-containing protein, partial [Anaerolineales bacterium]|nr:VWA domain-containing protein [Anaerolineales bacterium]